MKANAPGDGENLMEQQSPRRGRTLRILLVLIVLVGGAAAAGWLYLGAANGSDSGSESKDQTADTGEAPADGDEATEKAAKDGDEGAKEGEQSEEEKEKDAAIPVSVSEIKTGTVSAYISATANLVAEHEVKILAEAEGRVERLEVEEGDTVGREALLAGLVRDDAEIAVQKAEFRATTARSAFERAGRMAEQEMISPEDFDNITRDHRVAEQELAEAKWKLERTEVRAPFSGKITARMITLGQHVRPGDELFTVTDFDPLIARIFLPEKDVIGLSMERDVRISLKADDSVTFLGRIRQISPVVDTATGTVKVTIEASNPPRQVRPGGFVTVDIIKETRPGVVVLPREAVIRELQRAHVFVVKDEKTAEKRTVDLGLEEGERIQILSGVEAGEKVIVAGQGSLKNGSKVKIIPVATAEDAYARKDKVRPARG